MASGWQSPCSLHTKGGNQTAGVRQLHPQEREALALHARAGDCQTEVDQWCPAVKPGEGRLAKCMADQLAAEARADYKGGRTGKACARELDGFRLGRSRNINADLPLAKACKADADKLCATKYDVRPLPHAAPRAPPGTFHTRFGTLPTALTLACALLANVCPSEV